MALTSSACVTVDGLLAEGRLLEACRLAGHGRDGSDGSDATTDLIDDDGPADDAAVAAATASLIRARVEPISPDEQAALLGEGALRPVAMAWLSLQAPPSLVLHEVWSGGFVESDAAASTIAATLPPLEAPPRPSLPPGPLVMPPPATPPSPPSPPRSRGFIDTMFELATLPFTIVGEVGKALITIPLDLFGLRGPRGSSSSLANPPPDAERRDPGEAILPADAWTAEKERRLAAWAVEVAAVDAAREDRRRRLARVQDALRARCVVAGAGCRRLVMLDEGAADGTVLPAIRFKAGVVDVAGTCSVRRPVRVDAPIAAPSALATKGIAAVPVPVPVPPPPTTAPTPASTPALFDVPPIATASATTRLKAATTTSDGLDALACRVEVRPAWRRLARQGDLEIRLAAGQTVGRGATFFVPAAARVVVGAALPVQRGDHVKLAVSGNEGWIGGAVVTFDGTLPITFDGGSVVATCR